MDPRNPLHIKTLKTLHENTMQVGKGTMNELENWGYDTRARAHTHTHRCVCSRWKLPGSFLWERRTRCKRRSTWWDKRKRSCNWRRCNCCKRANCPPWSDNDASPWPGRLSSKLRWSEFARTPGRNRWSAVIAEIWRTASWRCACSRWRSSIFDLSLLKGLRRRRWNRNPRRICRTIFSSSNFIFHLSIRYILSTGVFFE